MGLITTLFKNRRLLARLAQGAREGGADDAPLPARNAGPFDALVDGLSRLPRPALAFGTLALFAFAMVNPAAFAARMEALAAMPEALWWFLGAIVAFYFGAREAHYLRRPKEGTAPAPEAESPAEDNAALAEWRRFGPQAKGRK